MTKIYAVCGKICCGKTTYCQALQKKDRAMLLSVDDLMLAIFPPQLGDSHDAVAAKAQNYLLARAQELVSLGVSVILDWGFWSQKSRDDLRAFCQQHKILLELHYLHLSDEEWARRIARRNAEVAAGRGDAYYVDEGLLEKLHGMFQEPPRDQVDVWIDA